ncbi:MAG TPA: serine hydrolase [Candidatus Baltobacteraceae bacterium]|nr:serine hydrolase [Candidatus Baltobacteraceae bacterium]
MERDLARLALEGGLSPASIVLTELESGTILGALDPERGLYPASMIKTPLVAATLAASQDGLVRLDHRVEVVAANMTFNDAPSPLHPGYRARVDELCELAIERSDNVATNVLFDVVGRERATQIVRDRFGLHHTAFYRKLSGSDPLIHDPLWDGVHMNAHPASDAAALFRLIGLDRLPHSDLFRSALARQYWNNKLNQGLREGDVFMHKTGDTDDVTHDGGILLTAAGRAFVIVAYTGLASTDEHNARFGPFMERLRALL